MHDVTPLNKSKLDHLFNLLVYKKADILFVHSNSNKRSLAQQIKLDEEKIKVVPHGDFDTFIPDRIVTKSEARKFFNLSEEQNVILFFGAIKKYKGLDILLNSLSFASKKINNLALIIAGEAGDAETRKLELEYKNIVSKLPKEIKVIYHASLFQMQKLRNILLHLMLLYYLIEEFHIVGFFIWHIHLEDR